MSKMRRFIFNIVSSADVFDNRPVTIWQVTSCGFAKNWIKTNAKKEKKRKNDVFLNQFRVVCLFYRFTTDSVCCADTIWKIWATVKTIIGGYVTHNIVNSSQIVISLENWRHEKPSLTELLSKKTNFINFSGKTCCWRWLCCDSAAI